MSSGAVFQQPAKGIDSLAELCRAKLNADPFSAPCLYSAAGAQPRSRS
jgi:hypothetical protein